jgi:hypothetical protein
MTFYYIRKLNRIELSMSDYYCHHDRCIGDACIYYKKCDYYDMFFTKAYINQDKVNQKLFWDIFNAPNLKTLALLNIRSNQEIIRQTCESIMKDKPIRFEIV